MCLALCKGRQVMSELVLCTIRQWSRDETPEILELGALGPALDSMQ